MLDKAYIKGQADAMERYKIAGPVMDWLGGAAHGAKNFLVGDLPTLKNFREQYSAGTLRKPGGMFHGAFWPTHPNPALKWLNRAGIWGYPAYEAYKALKGEGDPTKSTAEKVMGAAGSAVGGALGYPLGGLLGGGMFMDVGRRLGEGAGKIMHQGINRNPMPMQDPMTGYNY